MIVEQFFPKHLVRQLSFTFERVILINNSTNIKQGKNIISTHNWLYNDFSQKPKLAFFSKKEKHCLKQFYADVNSFKILETWHASIPTKTSKIYFGTHLGWRGFGANQFYSIFRLYAAATSCKKSVKFIVSICYKKTFLGQLLSILSIQAALTWCNKLTINRVLVQFWVLFGPKTSKQDFSHKIASVNFKLICYYNFMQKIRKIVSFNFSLNLKTSIRTHFGHFWHNNLITRFFPKNQLGQL